MLLQYVARHPGCDNANIVAALSMLSPQEGKQAGGYLKILSERYRMIERRLPMFASPRARTGRYYISDNFLRSWLMALQRPVSAVHFRPEAQLVAQADELLTDAEGAALEELTGRLYEKTSRKGLGDFPLSERIKGYWDRAGIEIDLVAVSEDGSANALAQLALGLIDSLEVDAGCLQRIETNCPADADTLATDFDRQDIVSLTVDALDTRLFFGKKALYTLRSVRSQLSNWKQSEQKGMGRFNDAHIIWIAYNDCSAINQRPTWVASPSEILTNRSKTACAYGQPVMAGLWSKRCGKYCGKRLPLTKPIRSVLPNVSTAGLWGCRGIAFPLRHEKLPVHRLNLICHERGVFARYQRALRADA